MDVLGMMHKMAGNAWPKLSEIDEKDILLALGKTL